MPSRSQSPRLALWIIVALIGHLGFAQSWNATPEKTTGAHPASFSFLTDHEPVISLDGLWRFQPGDDDRWASRAFDDSAWPLLRSDEPWTDQGYNQLSGFAWYRFRVQAPSPAMPLALLLPSILTDYEVFENGVKIGGFGQMPPHGSLRFSQSFLYPVPPAAAGATLQFAIRVWHHPVYATYLGGGPRHAGALLGETALLHRQLELLRQERLTRVAGFFAVGLLNAVVSLTVFGLYFYRRSEREYLWFAILLLTNALMTVLTISDFILNFPLGLRDVLAETLGSIGLAASLFFFSRVLEAKRSLMWRAVLILALLDPLAVGLYVFRLTSPATSTSLRILLGLPLEIYIVVLLCRTAISGNRNARLLFVPAILLYGTSILGGAFLLSFQLHWQVRTLASINQWNVIETPFPVPLEVLVELIFVVALLAFLIRRFARSRAKEERFSSDMEAARTLQHVLIPETLPTIPHLEISTAYHPAQEVGGDFYQIFALPGSGSNVEANTLIVLGDVAGKGLAAAMTVSMLVGALHSLVETTGSPAEILAGLNRRLLSRGSGFTTCLAIRLSPSGELTLANAGHLAPYRNGQELSSPPVLPLGLDQNAEFAEQTVQLAPGDRLTLLTDGIPEATSHRELFGFERTARLSSLPAAEIADAARRFGQEDDITVISIVLRH
jgi:sigma-B regulation protein RsbU (phosphoserine phosphatase)